MASKISTLNAVFIIITIILGYGHICMPKATAHIGYVNSLIFILIISILTYFSMIILFKSCEKKLEEVKKIENISYYTLVSDISEIAALCTCLLTFFVGYFIIISYTKTLGLYICHIFHLDVKKFSFYASMGVCSFHLILSTQKNMSFLKYTSYFSLFSCFITLSIILSYLIFIQSEKRITAFNTGFEDCAGYYVFALCCQNIIPIIYQKLDKNSSYYNVSILSSVLGGLSLLLFSMLGYFTIGDDLKHQEAMDILAYFAIKNTNFKQGLKKSFDNKGMLIIFCQILFTLLLNCSFIVQFYATKNTFFDLIEKLQKSNQNKKYTLSRTKAFFVSFVFLFTICLFSQLDFVKLIVDYTGLYLMNFISFILPAIIFFHKFGIKKDIRGSIMAFFCFFAGLGSMIILSVFKFKK